MAARRDAFSRLTTGSVTERSLAAGYRKTLRDDLTRSDMTSPDEFADVIHDVTYRATVAGGRTAEIRLRTTFAAATLADAWARLTALHGGVDPRSIEIELRELTGP
jgi:hypothetical protein